MKNKKAIFIKQCDYDTTNEFNNPIYEYEYRGKHYYVIDWRNGYSETMEEQHLREQKQIDDILNYNTKSNFIDLSELWEILNDEEENI